MAVRVLATSFQWIPPFSAALGGEVFHVAHTRHALDGVHQVDVAVIAQEHRVVLFLHVVVAADNLVVVVTENTVFIGDRNTDMKALVEDVAKQLPDIV